MIQVRYSYTGTTVTSETQKPTQPPHSCTCQPTALSRSTAAAAADAKATAAPSPKLLFPLPRGAQVKSYEPFS